MVCQYEIATGDTHILPIPLARLSRKTERKRQSVFGSPLYIHNSLIMHAIRPQRFGSSTDFYLPLVLILFEYRFCFRGDAREAYCVTTGRVRIGFYSGDRTKHFFENENIG
jgi:hypothetical protein